MIQFILGIIVGILLFAGALMVLLSKSTRIKQEFERREDAPLIQKDEVQIFEPTDEKIEAMEQLLHDNSERGLDTKIEDIQIN